MQQKERLIKRKYESKLKGMEEHGGNELFDLCLGFGVFISILLVKHLHGACNVDAPYQNWTWHIFYREKLLHYHLVVICIHLIQFLHRCFFAYTMLLHITVHAISHPSSAYLQLFNITIISFCC